ncbi:hypothetical protein Daus18300_000583 [Diaporthe australafricana]|uniref:NACHT-NTPase and P-loop NTPases N-terminal domain-containing protein n=1 Tax=Diaporthe australafricana TaxID=127596 RepID=A0ABR3Y4R5_9PEZI
MPTGVEEIGVVVASLKVALLVYEFLEIACKLADVPEDSKAFLRLLRQVETDFAYAVMLREDNLAQLQRHHSLQDKWIRNVLIATLEEMNDFGKFVQNFDDVRLPTFAERAKYLLRNHKSLALRAESLHGAHNRLLTCINGLHTISIQIQVRDKLLGEAKGMVLSPCSSAPSVLETRQARVFRGRASRRAPGSDDEDDDDHCGEVSPPVKVPEATGSPYAEPPPGYGDQN